MSTATPPLAAQPALRRKMRAYWQLTKSLQTGLLLITGVAGYMSARCPLKDGTHLIGLIVTLYLAISGSTVLNMVYDRDIDCQMKRSARRPLPSGRVDATRAFQVGLFLSGLGVGGAWILSPLYGVVVFAGWFIDVVIYTIWLKRRTAWSILWGGVAGGMPVLAGRVLGAGEIEIVGLLLALAVLLWIPTHIMTYGIRHAQDYRQAGVPTFANVYGESTTRSIVSVSTSGAVLIMATALWLIELPGYCLYATLSLGVILVGFTVISWLFPSPKLNFGLFKFASVYLLATMLLIIIAA